MAGPLAAIKNFIRPVYVRCKVFFYMERIKWSARRGPIRGVNRFEYKVYSQNGEDGILLALFGRIGTTNRYFVEFGTGTGFQCNTRYLRERRGWQGLMMDGDSSEFLLSIKKEFITAENINGLFEKYRVPADFDLLSIDVDGNDYWIWKALDARYRPRVIVIEYNASVPPSESRVIDYDPHYRWGGTDYFGGSLLAMANLGRQKGYTLVGCDQRGVNAFFVRDDELRNRFAVKGLAELYRPPLYGEGLAGHPKSAKVMRLV